MKLYLDSADINDIKRVSHTNAISGVTTNPSLMAKTESGDYFERLSLIAKTLASGVDKKYENRKHLSVEVITLDPNEMKAQANKLWRLLAPFENWLDVHIKIPVTVDTLPTITYLERSMEIKVNATACMMASQAKMAMDAGASVVSFFYNRMKDGGNHEPWRSITEFSDYKMNNDGLTEIICGSIRRPEDVDQCWHAGADAVTVSMKIIELLMSHTQTDIAIAGFQEDIDAWLK